MSKQVQPPHQVRDTAKLQTLAATMKENGWDGRAILAIEVADYLQALTGSHRLAACAIADVEPEIVEIEDVELTVDQVDEMETAVPSLTWKNSWSDDHYLSEALESARDDEDRLAVLRVVLGEDDEATALMAAEIEANR